MSQTQRISRNNTSITRDQDGTVSVTLHGTRVVSVAPNGLVTLNSGGFRTATTRTRINQVAHQWQLGFGVFQKDFSWFVQIDGVGTVSFYDGVTFRPAVAPDGRVTFRASMAAD